MKKILIITLAVILSLLSCTGFAEQIELTLLTREQAAEMLGTYSDGFHGQLNARSLDYFLQRKGCTTDEFLSWAAEQAVEWNEQSTENVVASIERLETCLTERGIVLPEGTKYAIGLTTMQEAGGAGGYTQGTTAFINAGLPGKVCETSEQSARLQKSLDVILAHELFHCISRTVPEFRAAMYGLIGFTINDEEFEIPENIREQIIANPDVERHDSWATFTINGEKHDCYLVFLSEKAFEKPGDTFFTCMYTGLVDISTGELFNAKDASDFFEVVGANTDYTEDPEECMATNFSYAVVYGESGPGGNGYATPELIEGILNLLSKD